MLGVSSFLWEPLLEGAAQTIVGVLGGYATNKAIRKISDRNLYEGAMDFWKRGIDDGGLTVGDTIVFDGLISPYTQLFPGDPMRNGTRWNRLYEFEGKISREQYQAMEFFAGSDVCLRLKSLNGETVVGLYHRYGYIGDGVLGVVSTKYLRNALSDFFQPSFFGARARIYGEVCRCPSAHYAAAKDIAIKAGVPLDISRYRNLHYLKVSKIRLATKEKEKVCTLLGSSWAVTENKRDQYLVQYGYMSEKAEQQRCLDKIFSEKAWSQARVFFDDVAGPSEDLSFGKTFIA